MNDPLGVLGVTLAEKFRIDRLLGEGGYGVVYGGVHLVLGEPIAVKFIKMEGTSSDPARASDEFLREARILFSLSHPAIVRMYDVGALDRGPVRIPWVVLELLSGQTLDQEIAQRRRQGRHWSGPELQDLFDPILEGLAFAHGRGIMHRDIKPSNLQLSRAASGRLEPKILDFGTARAQASTHDALGRTGFTPLYGAPEQWDKSLGPTTTATDVYALGLTILECATLQRPHGAADSVPAILREVMGGAGARGLRDARPDLPPALSAVLGRALAVQPAQRFRDAGELRGAVRAALTAPASGVSPSALTVPPLVLAAPHAPLASYGPPHGPAPGSPAIGHTTAPLVVLAPTQPSPPSSHGAVAIGLALLALVASLAAVSLGAIFYLRGGSTAGPDVHAGPGAPVPASRVAPRPISPPNVGSSDEFDRADAVAVVQKNHPAIEACAAKSHRFSGTIDVVFDVSARDGRVVGTDCHTVWPTHDSKHPKLDPEAAELCACIESVTPSWKFKPPKPEVALPFGEDSVWLHVKYVASK